MLDLWSKEGCHLAGENWYDFLSLLKMQYNVFLMEVAPTHSGVTLSH